MADRFRGRERRACSHSSAESLIGRLDELDTRLRQLEEKQSLPETYFTADHQCKSLSSALQDVCRNGTLIDRLHLLETRIGQLSSELDKGGSNAEKNKKQRNAHNHKLKPKDSKEGIDDMEKRANAVCHRNEKRRTGRTRIYKRWFPVGC